MKNKILITLILLSNIALSQSKTNDWLFVVEKDTTYLDSFKERYKNDFDNNVTDNFYDFVEFKKEVATAKKSGIQNSKEFKSEIKKIEQQLIKYYTYDREELALLAKKSYKNANRQIKIQGFNMQCDKKAALETYKKIKNNEKLTKAQEKIIKIDNLGYITTLMFDYETENQIFELKNNEYTDLISSVGDKNHFFVKKIDEKKNVGKEITTKIISIVGKDSEKKINKVYRELLDKKDFIKAYIEYTNDKIIRKKSGLVEVEFDKSNVIKNLIYDNDLKKNDFSKPIKLSDNNWIIIKIYGVEGFETLQKEKTEIYKKILKKTSFRIHLNKSLILKLKTKYNFEEYNNSDKIFSVKDKTYYKKDFEKYLKNTVSDYKNITYQNREKQYLVFVNSILMRNYLSNIYNENNEYRLTMQNIKEGLLLNKIYKKLQKTTDKEIEKYFKKNRGNFIWKDRADAVIAYCDDEKTSKKVSELLKNNNSTKSIENIINTNNEIKVYFKEGKLPKNHVLFPKDLKFEKGISIFDSENGKQIIYIKQIIKSKNKTFEEAKHNVKEEIISNRIGDFELESISLEETENPEIEKILNLK